MGTGTVEYHIKTSTARNPAMEKIINGNSENKSQNKTIEQTHESLKNAGYRKNPFRDDYDSMQAVHQVARFSNDPKLSHEKSVMRLCRYLLDTSCCGLIYKPGVKKGLKLFVDADFAGNWKNADAKHPENCLSRTGYVIRYNNCCILWKSLQTEITLSSTESEYIALSQALRQVLPVIETLKEFNKIFPQVSFLKPKVHCKVYEDNVSCIKMNESDKFIPRTKHISLKYHWFKEHARSGLFDIVYINTKEQLANILTKPLDQYNFKRLRKLLIGY